METKNAEKHLEGCRSKTNRLPLRKEYPESFRPIRFYNEEEDREFTFLTNAKHLSAQEVAGLYQKRWLIELFFKWLKQHLKIKKFWGTTENAVQYKSV